MKENRKKAAKWLLLGVGFSILTVVCFRIESNAGGRYRLTAGSGMIAVICLASVVLSLRGQMTRQEGKLIIEDIFQTRSGGCVVTGVVQGGLMTGEKVMIGDETEKSIKTKICGIEVYRKRVKAAVNTPAALYFKDVSPNQIHRGDIVSSI